MPYIFHSWRYFKWSEYSGNEFNLFKIMMMICIHDMISNYFWQIHYLTDRNVASQREEDELTWQGMRVIWPNMIIDITLWRQRQRQQLSHVSRYDSWESQPIMIVRIICGNKQSEQCFVADWECWVMAAIYRAMKSVTTSGNTHISKQREDNINKRFCGALHFLILSPWIQGRAVCQKPSHRKCTQLPTCR